MTEIEGELSYEARFDEIERRSQGNRRRVLELAQELNNVAIRLHKLEDHFDVDGIIQQLTETVYTLSTRLEQFIDEQQRQRPRPADQEHNDHGTDGTTAN